MELEKMSKYYDAFFEATGGGSEDTSIGWYRDMPAAEYHALDLPSSSTLSRLKRSPLHCRAAIETKEETRAMRIGSAYHCYVLEGAEKFNELFAVQPKFEGTGSVAARNEWKAQNSHKTILTDDEAYVASNMARATLDNPVIKRLLGAAKAREVSGIFREKTTNARCKVRIDALVPEFNATLDLKSCRDASPAGFKWQAVKYGMHRQGAIYADACEALGERAEHHIVLAQENEYPWANAVYRLSDVSMERGRKEYVELLKVWEECADTDNWPGYSEHIEELDLPLGNNSDITDEDLF
jgi:hypothetical protein